MEMLWNDETGEWETPPYVWQICQTCAGEGASSAYLGAYTAEEMWEQGPDFMEDYARGLYDRPCDECDGRGSVQVTDESRLTTDQTLALATQRHELAELTRMEAAERRFGC